MRNAQCEMHNGDVSLRYAPFEMTGLRGDKRKRKGKIAPQFFPFFFLLSVPMFVISSEARNLLNPFL